MYINDIFSATIRLRLFADNTCLSYQHFGINHVNTVINMELKKIDEWLCKNRLFITYLKTKFLLFNRSAKKNKFSVKVNCFEIEQSENTKHLGVV